MSTAKSQPHYNANVLGILKASNAGTPRTELRVVSWDNREPQLENRQIILDVAAKEERTGKIRGLSLLDLEYIRENWDQVYTLMTSLSRESRR